MGSQSWHSTRTIVPPLVVWSTEASYDIERHYLNLQPKNPGAAINAVQAIMAVGDSLGETPLKGARIDREENLRKWPVFFGKYGFIIHYAVMSDAVLITRVYHGAEDRPY